MPQDFSDMQRQAIERLREMQNRAAPPREEPPEQPAPLPPQPKPRPRGRQGGLFGSLLSMESDLALILPLLLLLGREGADDALLLALLYIMI